MGFSRSEEQSLLQESVERFVAQDYPFEKRRALAQTPLGYSADNWKTFARLGWLSIPFREENGGFGGGLTDVAVVAEVFGRGLVLEPYVPGLVLGGRLVELLGTQAHIDRVLAPVIAGEMQLALAHTERRSAGNPACVGCTVERDGDDYLISGEKVMVLNGPSADYLLVTARSSGAERERAGIEVFLVAAASEGIECTAYPIVDQSRAGDFVFNSVRVSASARLGNPESNPESNADAIETVINEAIVANCAEAIGAMDILIKDTIEYARTREQFGVSLASFQVLQHGMVDMYIAWEQSASMLAMALERVPMGGESARRAASALKVHVCASSKLIGEKAVQIHGGMGTTDELRLGHYFKRLLAIEALLGDEHYHLTRYAATLELEPGISEVSKPGDATGIDYEAFRREVRAFIKANLPDDLRETGRLSTGLTPRMAPGIAWQKIRHANGWAAPSWPVEYGGPGWDERQRQIFDDESLRADAPNAVLQGLEMCGPCLMGYGTQEQKDYFLPRMLAGEDTWCQGYSEPGSGSDLASLKTSAVSDGDDYLINGSKIWTSNAHEATHMFCLVRTSNEGRAQRGITFLLIDMASPGISVKPIYNLNRAHEQNQVFFDNVRVPKANRVGQENQGWTVAKYLLEFERGGVSRFAHLAKKLRRIKHAAAQQSNADGTPLIDDPCFRREIAALEIEATALEFTWRRILEMSGQGQTPGVLASLTKTLNGELTQELDKWVARTVGLDALPLQPQALVAGANATSIVPDHAITAMASYLEGRGRTIAGGTSEVQRGIIAKSVLGL
ncbi:MAG: acyl-CoA dehydrogenase family protein [Burkholderiaceae bacterium]